MQIKNTEEEIIEHEELCKETDIKSALREINTSVIDIELNQMKVNLPDSIAKFELGNGEGIWAGPYTSVDLEIYTKDILNEEFEVVLLNQAITYPFLWGSVITVKNIRPGCRPVLSREWIEEVIYEVSEGSKTLETFLK